MGCPTSVSTQYSNVVHRENLQKRVRSKFTVNQEALIFPRLACSLRQDSLVQRPLSYADDLQSWVTITNDSRSERVTAGDFNR